METKTKAVVLDLNIEVLDRRVELLAAAAGTCTCCCCCCCSCGSVDNQ